MLEKLKLRTQILIFLVSLIILITLIVAIQQVMVLQRSLEILSLNSREILQKQIDRSLNTQSHFINRIVSRQFRIQQKRGDSVNLIYRFLDLKGNDTQIIKPDPCVKPEQINSVEFNLTRVCFGVFNSSEKQQIPLGEQYFKQGNLVSLLNQYSTVIDSTIKKTRGRMYVYSSFEKQLACLYPAGFIIPQFNPQATSFYQQHIQSGQLVSYSSLSFLIIAPYSSRMVITQSLLDKNLHLDGVIGIDLIFAEQQLENIKNNLFIISQQGQIVLANVDFYINFSQVSYIFNETQSGFNQQDWQEIQKVLNGQLDHQQCSNGKYLCLFNSIMKEEVQIIVTKIQSGFISIMLSTDLRSLINMLSDFEQEFMLINLQTVIIQIGFCIIILIITLFSVFLLTKPINNIINIVKKFTLKYGQNIDKEIFIEGIFRRILSQAQSKFDIVISIIKQQETNKNIYCLILDKFQLPKHRLKLSRDFQFKFQQIQNTVNDASDLRFIQQVIHNFYNSGERKSVS